MEDKMVWSGKRVAKHLTPVQEDQINPNGVDVRVSKVLKNTTVGALADERHLPKRTEVKPTHDVYRLERGSYVVVYKEKVHIPLEAVGLVLPRSSLMRMGGTLNTAVWDPGYEGQGEGLLVVHNTHGLHIGRNARIGQMVFFSAVQGGTYNGTYQGERIEP